MTIGSVSGASSANNLQGNSLGIQDLIKVLTTQLNYQDPMKPVDNQQFMAQMAQFTALQQTQELNSKVSQLIVNQSALQSVGLIGRNVDISYGSATIAGKVVSLSLSGDSPTMSILTTSGSTLDNIGLNQITNVR
ncbi:flagellar hook assembly protein FlgD [Undibacterium flavidum]|uniref:Basal-body rod modification protein FlgD n=1 Tax=Undibacterium flavidum TaxID=2762297 RepID=A0ABR6YER0_9BURK|nr:flagellar hook capping FlgD N-terminal domain-containing protein [Undibacterium flavidum]MBC3875056.1 flagellar hook capping protein [Undibacterium flavidum]